MSAPRTKRQFAGASADPSQRQITSFFTARTFDDVSAVGALQGPVLPASIQSNLLSVGMRVRKSVPEGYKTNSPSAFKLWTDNTPVLPTKSLASIMASSRELLPFCGINRVGGLDTQPDFHYDDQEDVPGLDAIPELTMSQDSVEGNESSRKRFFDEDDGEQLSVSWDDKSWGDESWDGQVSPRSLAPMRLGNARLIAVPKTRAKRNAMLRDMGQENMAVDDDFEDADFLAYEEEDVEIDMAG